MNALETALQTKLSGDTTLMGYVSGVYNTVAAAPTCPYLVYQKIDGTDEYTFTERIRTQYLYQVRVIGKGYDKSAIGNALARVDALLTDATLSITGYTTWLVRREGDIPDMVEDDTDGVPLIQVGATYTIEVAAT